MTQNDTTESDLVTYIRWEAAHPADGGPTALLELAANEIERLRARLAKIANAPVSTDNKEAMLLKGWALPRDGEFPYA